jgi:hypothetical protein
MDEQDEPGAGPERRWLGWALVAVGAAGGLWLAALPLDQMLPEPRTRRAPSPEPPAVAGPPESTGSESAPAPDGSGAVAPTLAPAPQAEALEPPAATPSAEWVEEGPGEDVEAAETASREQLRTRLERQLEMNDLGGVRVEIAGDRVVTSGRLPRPGDRQRVALLVRSLAPGFVHQDEVQDADGPP